MRIIFERIYYIVYVFESKDKSQGYKACVITIDHKITSLKHIDEICENICKLGNYQGVVIKNYILMKTSIGFKK